MEDLKPIRHMLTLLEMMPEELMSYDEDIFIAKGGYQGVSEMSVKEIKRLTHNKYIKKINKWQDR